MTAVAIIYADVAMATIATCPAPFASQTTWITDAADGECGS